MHQTAVMAGGDLEGSRPSYGQFCFGSWRPWAAPLARGQGEGPLYVLPCPCPRPCPRSFSGLQFLAPSLASWSVSLCHLAFLDLSFPDCRMKQSRLPCLPVVPFLPWSNVYWRA